MSKTVRVDLGERSYDIHVGFEQSLGPILKERGVTRVMLVVDSNVDGLYGNACIAQLEAGGCEVVRAVVQAGELSKSLKVAEELYSKAIDAGLDRKAFIVALGGGMVGDLAGFVAGTFHRGMGFVQIPTSLLAMVDSSVGGKTAVNLDKGKNLIGVFHQPVEVVADLARLNSLPDREYRSGLAEVVKYGVIWDAVLFRKLESNPMKILGRDPVLMEDIVARCCEIKAEIVHLDEREENVRSILNFGHTLGHAIEKALKYGTVLHGEAVAAGMSYAATLSVMGRGFSENDGGRIIRLLKTFGLPVDADGLPTTVKWSELRDGMTRDKKSIGRKPRFVLAEKIGQVAYGCEVDEALLEKAYGVWQCQP